MSYITAAYCGNDHADWLRSLDFHKAELDILEDRLREVAKINTVREVLAWVEHFQNQFVVQRNNVDEIKHSIREHDQKVKTDSQAHEGKMDTALVTEHEEMKELFTHFEKVVSDLRHEFKVFLAGK